jgi:SpoIID/LytB domain protein
MGRTHILHRLHPHVFAFCAIFVFLVQSTLSAAEPTMRVGITSAGKPRSITIHCDKPFSVMGKDGAELTLVDGKDAVFSASGGIDVTVDSVDMGSSAGPLRLVPSDASAIFEIVSSKTKCRRFRGTLEINGKSGLSLVNELAIEDYVRGVLPMEVPQNFHPEAQKALTVAIRTYALTSLGRHKSAGFDVCDTTDCQGFCGASRDAAWVDKLIDDTRGQVLTYQGKLVHAVYSTDCGGVTQSNEDAGFGSDPWPYLRSVPDHQESGVRSQEPEELPTSNAQLPTPNGGSANPQSAIRDPQSDYCSGCPNHTWTKTYTGSELGRAFSRLMPSKAGKFQSMEFAEYDSSGRVGTVLVKGDKGEYRMTGGKFRGMFGETVIKSTMMTLTATEDGQYTINGRGYGHGVGLCAYGANGLGKAGMSYADILRHYYTGVEIKAISDLGLRIAD